MFFTTSDLKKRKEDTSITMLFGTCLAQLQRSYKNLLKTLISASMFGPLLRGTEVRRT